MKRYIKSAKTLEDYENMGVFDVGQMREIREGLESGIDVSWYADPKYDWTQMWEIRAGLKRGLDVSWYADPKFASTQMNEIWSGLEKGVDVSIYADPKYDWKQMNEIRKDLEKGVDVSVHNMQMDEISKGSLGNKKKSLTNWKSLVNQLQSEYKAGIDSQYEQTQAGQYVESICQQVESKLGIFVEPSIQAGHGSMYLYKDEMTARMDYEQFNEEIYNLAVTALSKKAFESSYEEFLNYRLMWEDEELDNEW